ncbi:MAG TPA: matrixin family metalloprotease, partial [Planctomycetota bacterium]|nr:matrixin family metalloprotease [Planctomycetota bacterium]
MKARAAAVAIALAAAAAVSLPVRSSGFQTLGFALTPDRIGFQTNPTSFTDPASNNNLAPDANWPAGVGADLAIRKAASEWCSELRGGTGAGDPLQPSGVGSGASNFDFEYQGTTAGSGGLTSGVVRSGGLLGIGLYAVTQSFATGWSMVFDNSPQNGWDWQDGPGSEVDPTSKIDIQGIATHEFGHALGLGHSSTLSATMHATTSTDGSVNWRSI